MRKVTKLMTNPSIPCPPLAATAAELGSRHPAKYRDCIPLPLRQFWLGPASMPAEEGQAFVGAAEEGLSFYTCFADSDIFSQASADDQRLWTLGDVAEVFVKPGKERSDYWEVHLSPNGYKMDIHIPDRARFIGGEVTWDQVIAARSGVQTRTAEGPGQWTAELCIPWSAFGLEGRAAPGSVWQFAVCRYNYNGGLDNPEHSSTAHLSQVNFHRYEDFTDLVF